MPKPFVSMILPSADLIGVSDVSLEVPEGSVMALVCTENLNPDVVMMKSAEYRA